MAFYTFKENRPFLGPYSDERVLASVLVYKIDSLQFGRVNPKNEVKCSPLIHDSFPLRSDCLMTKLFNL